MIKINDVTFDAVVTTGTDGSMSFEFNPSGMTLTEIEELFSSGVEIELMMISRITAVKNSLESNPDESPL